MSTIPMPRVPMRTVLAAFAVLCGLMVVAACAQDQSALARLEQQINGARPAQQPAVEPGYLGAAMDDTQEAGRGIRVLDVVAGSPAEAGGLAVNDLIVEVNRQPVRNLESLAEILFQIPAGNTVSFAVVREDPTRGAETIKLQATLGKRPNAAEAPFPDFGLFPGGDAGVEIVEARFAAYGFSARAMDEQIQQQINAATAIAVLITGVAEGSPAAEGGLQPGDLVIQVDRTNVRTPGELANAMQANGNRASTLVINRAGVTRQVELPPWPAMAAGEEPADDQQGRRGPLVLEPPAANADERIRQLEQRVAALEEMVRRLQQQNGGG